MGREFAYDANTQKVEGGESEVKGHPLLYRMFQGVQL